MAKFNYLIIILLFIHPVFTLGQNPKLSDEQVSKIKLINHEIDQAKILAHKNPAEAQKKLLQIKEQSMKTGNKSSAINSAMGLMLMYYNEGNYKKTIEESRFIEKYARELQHTEYLSDTYRMRGITYGEMGLLKECFAELEKSLPYAEQIKVAPFRFYKKALIYEAYANTYDKEGNTEKQLYYRQKSITESNKIDNYHQLAINAKYQNLAYQYASIGLVYSNLKVNDSADYYFDKALAIYENKNYDIYINGKATLLSDMAVFYSNNGKHSKAVAFAKRAEALEKQTSLPYIRKDIYHTLFSSYVETNKQDSSKYYLNLYSALNDSLVKAEKQNIMTPVRQIIADKDKESKNTVRGTLAISAVILLTLMPAGWIYWKRKNRISHKKYEELITKISSEQTEIPEKSVKTDPEAKTSVSITDETVKILLARLEKFELSEKYLRKDISLTWMANHFNTNTKYLSEIIKTYRDKNFTTYINSLRIGYITKKLYENPVYREYKINYLAEECGYATPQVFVTAFKKETGFTPSYFLEQIKVSVQSVS
ncbi:MAG: helix-turn-helix domain-containing protein [Chryseobacterium sp.]|jgi:AraC-like DNA-binding protein|uniref:helix-turn-helix domain-containing protein n=1 Tax=Chryseobacterium sp. TaxID=1871047 RepID=UPI002835C2EA|nr:helix-turn-helix domain-containing protein [Chryseobacterium sp.]MDR2235388.1 helix-turn-helix domain-containing protein [Chryseobacterium sp.]